MLHRINDEASANSMATFNLKNESSNLNLQINELKRRIAELENQVNERNEQLKAMHESTSWRITAALRSLAGMVRKPN